jgi:hypothetical protein
LASGVFGAYSFVLGFSLVDPLASDFNLAVLVGFFGSIFIVDRIFRKLERAHCERTQSTVTPTPFSGTRNS